MSGDKCPLCGLKRVVRYEGAGESYLLVRCRNCTLVFDIKVPDDTKRVYSEKYYIGTGLKGGYHNYFEESVVNKLTFRHRLARIIASVGSKHISLLDVGCGLGDFLEVARSLLVTRCVGIEISDFALLNCGKKGLEVYSTLGGLTEKFDVVTIQDAVEHVRDPVRELRRINRLLKLNGLLFLTTPNINSLSAKVFGRYWYHYKKPEHLFYFDPVTIRILLEKAGFENIEIKPTLSWVSIKYLLGRMTFYFPRNKLVYFPKLKGLLEAVSDNVLCKIAFPIYTGEIEVWATKKELVKV